MIEILSNHYIYNHMIIYVNCYNKLFPNSICFKWKELNFWGSSPGTVRIGTMRLMTTVEINFLSLNNQSKLESWHGSVWEIWSIMNIPKRVENKPSRKTQKTKNKASCQFRCTSSLQKAEFLTHLLLPFPCLFQIILFWFWTLATTVPATMKGKNSS